MIILICVIVLVLGAAGIIEALGLIGWSFFETLRQAFSRDRTKG